MRTSAPLSERPTTSKPSSGSRSARQTRRASAGRSAGGSCSRASKRAKRLRVASRRTTRSATAMADLLRVLEVHLGDFLQRFEAEQGDELPRRAVGRLARALLELHPPFLRE